MAVEGAVGQVDHLGPVKPPFGLEIEKRLLDAYQRHRTVHRVFRHRVGVDVERLAACQDKAVVVRLVAVAVEKHDVARCHDGLVHHLVRGRCAVRHEEHVVGPEGPRRHVLRFLDVAGRLQKAVETAGRSRGFRKEKVQPVEFAHVADPVGLEDRLAPRDRQRVEGADGSHRVFLEVVEEGGAEAVRHAFKHRQVQLQQLFDRIENAANVLGPCIAGDAFDVTVGQQVNVKLGTQLLQPGRQGERQILVADRSFRVSGGLEESAQDGRVMVRGIIEAFVDRHCGKAGVQDGGADRVFKAADGHRFVDEGVFGTAKLAQLGDLMRAPLLSARGDDEHFEVGPTCPTGTHGGRIQFGRSIGHPLGGFPGSGVMLVGPNQDRF